MQAFLFSLFYGFTWLLSDFTFVVMYYLVGYRKGVVQKNLRNSFPDKSEQELKKIERKFYRHLCDLMLETLVLLHTKLNKALKLCKFNNLDLFDKFHQEGKSVVLVTGHYGNWELYGLMAHQLTQHFVGIYKPLTNPRYDRIMLDMRQRFKAITVPMNDTLRALIDYKRKGEPIVLLMIADQTPAKSDIRYWTTFLNQPTAVFLGAEKLSQKFDMPVVFSVIRRVKRGQYEVDFELLTETPNEFKPYELTDLHVKRLEQQIMETPQYWLWSHKRWKIKPTTIANETVES